MRRQGFTLVEIATVLCIAAILAPLIFAATRQFEALHFRSLADLDAAASMRDFSADLSADLRRMCVRSMSNGSLVLTDACAPTALAPVVATAPSAARSLALRSNEACGQVHYRLGTGGILRRTGDPGCGPPRTEATHVAALTPTPWGFRIVFQRDLGTSMPLRTTFAFAFPEGAR